MTDKSLPPVGATVTDARGYYWRFGEDMRWHLMASAALHLDTPLLLRDHDAALVTLHRMQQERDQLKTESRAIMQTYAIESDQSLTECVTRTIEGWRERCEMAEARVSELEEEGQAAMRDANNEKEQLTFRVAALELGTEHGRLVRTLEERVAELEKENTALRAALKDPCLYCQLEARDLQVRVAELEKEVAQCVRQEVSVSPDGRTAVFVERRGQRDGSFLWAIRDSFGAALDKSGTWWVEPPASDRSDEYLASTRWATRAEAVAAARAAQEVTP